MDDQAATTREILELFSQHGDSQYGGEAVSQLEHALQAAFFAEKDGCSDGLIVASFLHDIGHLLHDLPEDAPEHGIDDLHESLGGRWLAQRFGDEIVQPVALHVAAKRYLCAVDEAYIKQLSAPSRLSLNLQGGPMASAEVEAFEQLEHWEAAVRLRRYDDAAKVPQLATPSLEHFAEVINRYLSQELDGSR